MARGGQVRTAFHCSRRSRRSLVGEKAIVPVGIIRLPIHNRAVPCWNKSQPPSAWVTACSPSTQVQPSTMGTVRAAQWEPTVTLVRGKCQETVKTSHSIVPPVERRYTQTCSGERPRHTGRLAYLSPGAERSSPRWCKACHSWTGPSGSVCGLPPPPGPPPCSASRAASTGDRRDCERFGAAAATRAPARTDGVGGGGGGLL